MGLSAIQQQRDIIVDTIKQITRGDWKVLVIDEATKRIMDNVVKEDDILNENIAVIERIEEKRGMNPEMDAIYILSPEPHIVDCLMADFERRRYKRAYLVWTALLDPQMRRRIDSSRAAQEQLAGFETLSIDYFPRESHLVTFRDPWSFPMLYNPSCNSLVVPHMQSLAQKITGICVSLGEYPKVRYYRPRNPTHEASILCSHLAKFVQEELDAYAQYNQTFPPPTTRPQGILLITDRSMDLAAPLVHEFTYQAMAHDLLPIKDADKVLFKTTVHEGQADEEQKDVEISEKDKIWVEHRHRHVQDTSEKLIDEFKKFVKDNPQFTNASGDATSLNAIKEMMAGLPQFQEAKEAFTLHLTMAKECMDLFRHQNLSDIGLMEQTIATGLDEDYRKPKNVTEKLVELLDTEAVKPSDRLRLIILYIMFCDGLIIEDIHRLLAHAALPSDDFNVIRNMELLGIRATKELKDGRAAPQPLFPPKTALTAENPEYVLSRFEPMVKMMLENVVKGTLDQATFPYTRPPLDSSEELAAQAQTSLRSAKPTWARNRMSTTESRQRVIVFMAGGATYSESRACYEVSRTSGRDVFLATSHMLSPPLFIRQIRDLDLDRKRLDLPIDRPKPKAPAHLFERNEPPRPNPAAAPPGPRQAFGLPNSNRNGGLPKAPGPSAPPSKTYDARLVPTAGLAAMSINSSGGRSLSGTDGHAKLEKKSKGKEESGEKKKRHFFGSKK